MVLLDHADPPLLFIPLRSLQTRAPYGPVRSPAPPHLLLLLLRCPLPFPSAPQTLLPGSALLPPPSLRGACLLPPPLREASHRPDPEEDVRAPRRRSSEPSIRAATARRRRAVRPRFSRLPSATGMGPIRPALSPWPRHLLRCFLLLGALHLGHPGDAATAPAALPGKALPTWPTSGANPRESGAS